MIKGTPLIGTFRIKDGDFHVQTIVVFDGEGDKQNSVITYNPRTDSTWSGSKDGLMTIDGRPLQLDGIDIVKWEELVPKDIHVSEDHCVLRHPPDPEVMEQTIANIKVILTKYADFKRKKTEK